MPLQTRTAEGSDGPHQGLGDAYLPGAIAAKPDLDMSAMLRTDAPAATLMALAASPDPRHRQNLELSRTFTSQHGIFDGATLIAQATAISDDLLKQAHAESAISDDLLDACFANLLLS